MERQLHECLGVALPWGNGSCTSGECVLMNVSLTDFNQQGSDLEEDTFVTGNFCKCEPGWTGLSDWVNADGCDCQIHILSIFVMWIICLSVYGLAAVWSIPRIIASYNRISRNKKQTGAAKASFAKQLRQNGSFIMCAVHLFITTPAAFGLGLVEILTFQRIGIDWVPTILFLLWRTSFYACSVVFQPYMLSTIVGKIGKESRDAVRDFSRKSNYLTLFTWVIGFLVLGSMFARSLESQAATFATYSILVAIVQIGFFWQARFTRNKISAILDKSYESVKKDEILEVKAKLVRMQGSVMKQTLLIAILYTIFGAIPYFWNKFPYFIPFTVLLPGLLFINAVRTLAQDSKKDHSNSSSMSDFKRKMTNFNLKKHTEDDKKPKLKLPLDPIKDEIAQSSVNYTSDGTPMEGTQVPYVHGLELSFAKITSTADPTEIVRKMSKEPEQIEHKTYLPSPSRIMAKISAITTPSKRGFNDELHSLNDTDVDESNALKSSAVESSKNEN